MKPGSWPSIALIYLFGVLAAASLSKIIPLQLDLQEHVGVTAGFGLLISLISLPAALLATFAGWIVDRVGARTALITAAGVGVLANLLYLFAATETAFRGTRLFEGLVMIGVYSSAPALIMATTTTERRGRAMALWSTYTPVGVSLGLLLSSGFAGTAHWRGSYLIHGVLFALLAVAGVLLPRPQPVPAGAAARPGLLSAFTQQGPLRVALVFAMLVITGLGTNTVFPRWYAGQHDVSLGVASGIMGVANLTMIFGGLLTAWILARGMTHLRWFVMIVIAGFLCAIAVFSPGIASLPRLAGLVGWLLASGACVAVVTAMLPKVVADPRQGAAAAGLLSQLAAATTFVTPLIWVPLAAAGAWQGFLAVIAAAGIAGILLFPRPRHTRH